MLGDHSCNFLFFCETGIIRTVCISVLSYISGNKLRTFSIISVVDLKLCCFGYFLCPHVSKKMNTCNIFTIRKMVQKLTEKDEGQQQKAG